MLNYDQLFLPAVSQLYYTQSNTSELFHIFVDICNYQLVNKCDC